MRSALLSLCLLIVCPGLALAQTPAALSLDDAVAMALAANRSLADAALAEERTALRVVTARSQRLPRIGVEAQLSSLLRPVNITFREGAFGTFPSTGPVPSADTRISTPAGLSVLFNVSVSQPLTQLHGTALNVELQEAARDLDREALRATRLALVNEVKHAYYRILEATSALEAADANRKTLQELERLAGNRASQQVALDADLLDVKARAAGLDLNVLLLRNAIASSKEQLNRLLGRDVNADFTVVAAAPAGPPVAPDTAARQIANRPDVRQAALRLRQAEIAVRVARWDYVPGVSLAMASISPLNIDGAPRNITTLGVQLQWEPFDWGRRDRTVADRSLAVRQAQHALAETEARATIEIHDLLRRADEMRARLRLAAASRDAARERLRVQVNRYEARVVLLSEVLQAEATVADIDNQHQDALLKLLATLADLDRALGEDVTK